MFSLLIDVKALELFCLFCLKGLKSTKVKACTPSGPQSQKHTVVLSLNAQHVIEAAVLVQF